MIQMHSSGGHLLCFTFHSLGRETVKQRLGAVSAALRLTAMHSAQRACSSKSRLRSRRMQQDLLSADELLGNIDSFTVEQRTARETFIKQELHLPREWLCEDGCG